MATKPRFGIWQLIDKGALFRIAALMVLASISLGLYATGSGAFDRFYEFSRAHEDWELDEIVVTAIAMMLAVCLTALVALGQINRRLIGIAEATVQLERRAARNEKLQAMGTLLGGVAHSVNNHLQPILTLSRLTKDELPEDSEAARDLARIILAANSASTMLRQVLNFSRHTDPAESTGCCEIDAALRDTVDLLAAAMSSSVRLRCDLPRLGALVALSRANVETITINLVNNAVDAMEGKVGEIHLSLARGCAPRSTDREAVKDPRSIGSWVCLRVRDNGKGMDRSEVARIFDPFFTTKPVGKGTGLGLSETYGVVRGAGGAIDVVSAPGQGTEFAISLPLLAQQADTATA